MLILDTKTETYTELQPGALMIGYLDVQWNLSITDTIGTQHFVRESEVSLTQGLPVLFPVGVVLHNLAVEHNVVAFSELFLSCKLAGKAKQRLILRVTALI